MEYSLIKYSDEIAYRTMSKIRQYAQSGRIVKVSPYYSLANLTETQKEILWKNFVNKTEPIENEYNNKLKKYFIMQFNEIKKRMDKYSTLNQGDIDNILYIPNDWNKELTDLNTSYNLASIKVGGTDRENSLKEYEFDWVDVVIQTYLINKEAVFAYEVNTYTYALLQNTLIDGMRAGDDIRMLTNRINGIFDFNEKYRARRIARTEVNAAANFGSYQSSIQSGVVWGHQWIAALDERTRDDHRELGAGQVKRELNTTFTMASTGDELLHPGDQVGNPASWINCRCTLMPLTNPPNEGAE